MNESKILHGWKEIAGYLGCGVRTVQRWELELGLPIRRPRGKQPSNVFAVSDELDAWMNAAQIRVSEADRLRARITDLESEVARLRETATKIARSVTVQCHPTTDVLHYFGCSQCTWRYEPKGPTGEPLAIHEVVDLCARYEQHACGDHPQSLRQSSTTIADSDATSTGFDAAPWIATQPAQPLSVQ